MIQQLPDESERSTQANPARTHRLAVLALVFAVVVPPVGIVLGILVLRQAQRAPRDRRLAIGALLVAALVLIAELLLLIVLTTLVATTDSTPTAETAETAAGAISPPGAGPSTADSPASGTAAADPQGIRAACDVVMPALGQVRSDVARVKSADQYGEVLTQLATTIVTGAGAASDPTFLRDVGQLSQAFQKAWQDSSTGKAPSAVADELITAGAPVSRDCTTAGYHP